MSVRVEALSDFRAAKFYKETTNPEISFKRGDVFRMIGVDEQAGWGLGEIENNNSGESVGWIIYKILLGTARSW